jgi:hypothetical protein
MATLRGSCQCGGVQFDVPDDFLTISFCHCATCKKISGGVGTASAGVPTESIRLLAGDDLVRTYQPDEGSAKTFCSVCGSNLFGGGWPESESSSVRLSAFGLDYDRKPEGHTFVRSAAAWEILPDDGLPRYDERAT